VTLPPIDFDAAYRDGNPYPTLAQYRDEIGAQLIPADPERDESRPWLTLFRHADCLAALRDNRLGREFAHGSVFSEPEIDSFRAVSRLFMLFRDPPVHTRLRSVSNLAFTPRQVEKMRPSIEATAQRLIEGMREAGDGVDLIGEFAFPLPMLVIAGMLGIGESDYRLFRDASASVAAAIDGPGEGLESLISRVDEATAFMSAYLRDLIAERKRAPRDDLLTSLIRAESEEGKLNEQELIATCILLIVAGHETTVNLIGNGVLTLMRHRDQWHELVADSSLARSTVEEVLRYEPPVQITARVALEPVTLAGYDLQPGSEVTTVLASANRDPAAYPDPERFDIHRPTGRHVSFGMGIHFCLGAPLARMEGEIAFATLARELPELSLVSESPRWRPGVVFHGLHDLPVRLG
jgi:cytochrome P450